MPFLECAPDVKLSFRLLHRARVRAPNQHTLRKNFWSPTVSQPLSFLTSSSTIRDRWDFWVFSYNSLQYSCWSPYTANIHRNIHRSWEHLGRRPSTLLLLLFWTLQNLAPKLHAQRASSSPSYQVRSVIFNPSRKKGVFIVFVDSSILFSIWSNADC